MQYKIRLLVCSLINHRLYGRGTWNRTTIAGFGDRYTNRCTMPLSRFIVSDVSVHEHLKITYPWKLPEIKRSRAGAWRTFVLADGRAQPISVVHPQRAVVALVDDVLAAVVGQYVQQPPHVDGAVAGVAVLEADNRFDALDGVAQKGLVHDEVLLRGDPAFGESFGAALREVRRDVFRSGVVEVALTAELGTDVHDARVHTHGAHDVHDRRVVHRVDRADDKQDVVHEEPFNGG